MRDREFRIWKTDRIEIREKEDGTPTLRGVAAPFLRYSQNLGGFVEQVSPGAFAETLSRSADQWIDFQHDPRTILGSVAAGTARFTEDDDLGLVYEVDLNPEDPDAVRVKAKVQRGDVRGSSFVFSVMPDGERWDVTEEGFPLRTLTRVRMYSAGPVVNPAYLDTTAEAAARALAGLAESRNLSPEEVHRAAAEGTLRDLIVEINEPTGDDDPTGTGDPHPVDRIAVRRRRLDLLR